MLGWKFTFKINKKAPKIVKTAIMKWLLSASIAPEREAKLITTKDEHVITWRYRASINLNQVDWLPRQTVPGTESNDWIHEESLETLSLKFWTNVEYAESLEKKYSILARALDMSKSKMQKQFARWIKFFIDRQK